MRDYLFLMHDDTTQLSGEAGLDWAHYLARLREAGVLQGGSAIGAGLCARKSDPPPAVTKHLTGFIRIAAANLVDAQAWLAGNPVYEAGGTVEIRELPRTD